MQMMQTHSGQLRAMGYDASKRVLRVELENGQALEYANVGASLWQQLAQSSAPWSYYRDNIADEFTVSRVSSKASAAGKNPLDDLFG